MKSIQLKSLKGKITVNIPKIFDLNHVLDAQDTVLDPLIQENGAIIELPCKITSYFGEIDKIKVPPVPYQIRENIITLDDIAVKANNILRVIDLYKSGNKTVASLTKSVKNFHDSIIARIIGKQGLICRNILGRRAGNTARAVLAPSLNRNPGIAEIPARIMNKLRIHDGDKILIGRDPAIWSGSIEIVAAYSIDQDVIRLHPLLFKQLGADCDGDTVWMMKLSNLVQANLLDRSIEMIKNSEDNVYLASSGRGSVTINKDNVNKITNDLHLSTGFSVGPEDLNNTEFMNRFKASTGKNIQEESLAIKNGLDQDKFDAYIKSINLTMLIQKIYLGPVGASAQKIKLIAAKNPALIESANYVSERIQQMLFDAKASIKGDDKDLNMFFEILEIFSMTKRYSQTKSIIHHSQILERLTSFNLDVNKCCPIVMYLYSTYPLILAIKELRINGIIRISEEKYEKAILLANEYISKDSDINPIIDMLQVNKNILFNAIVEKKRNVSLSNILNDPLYDLINPFSKDKIFNGILYLKEIFERNPLDLKSSKLTDNVFYKSILEAK